MHVERDDVVELVRRRLDTGLADRSKSPVTFTRISIRPKGAIGRRRRLLASRAGSVRSQGETTIASVPRYGLIAAVSRPTSARRAPSAAKAMVITGPAKGMGAAITKAFAAEGCTLALIGRDTAAIEPVAAQAKAAGARGDRRAVRPHRRRRMRAGRADDRSGPTDASTSWSTSPAARGRSARPAWRPRRRNSTTSSPST